MEPTNNDAERAIRPLVLKRKISGPSRSRRGEQFIAHSFSAMESCRRQGRDLIEFTHRSILAWIDKTAPPSLVPVGWRGELRVSAASTVAAAGDFTEGPRRVCLGGLNGYGSLVLLRSACRTITHFWAMVI